jgi:hypothetical protein
LPLPFQPVSLGRSLPFSNPDFLYELKYDGFRAMVHVEHGRCRLVSRNGNEFKTFSVLNTAIATEIKSSSVIDGEIVCLDKMANRNSTIFFSIVGNRNSWPSIFCHATAKTFDIFRSSIASGGCDLSCHNEVTG